MKARVVFPSLLALVAACIGNPSDPPTDAGPQVVALDAGDATVDSNDAQGDADATVADADASGDVGLDVQIDAPIPVALTSVAPATGKFTGSKVVLHGTSLDAVTAVKVGGFAAQIGASDSIHIEITTPRLPPGVYDVVAETGAGPLSLPHAFTVVFNYADVPWELDLEGNNRTNSQITGTASAGHSGDPNRVLMGTAPDQHDIFAGVQFNGRPSVQWKSTELWSAGKFVLGDIITGESFTVVMALRANHFTTTVDPYPQFPHDLSRIVGPADGHGYWVISLGRGTIIGGVATAAVVLKTVEAPFPAGVPAVVAFRLKGTTLGLKVGSGAWVTTSGVGTVGGLFDYLRTISNAKQLPPADADIERLSITKDALSDAEVDAAMQAVAAQDGITL